MTLADPPAQPQHRHPYRPWFWGLGLLMAAAGVWLRLAPQFTPDAPLTRLPVLALAGVGVLAGGAYLWLILGPARHGIGIRVLGWILAAGLIMRLLMLPTLPILEDDHNRYLWDGAVTAHGYSPYAHSPSAAAKGDAALPPALKALAAQATDILKHVNYPWLRSIYPPLAQGALALAHLIDPFGLAGWRLVLLLADLAGLALIWRLAKLLGLGSLPLAVYWLNPLIIKEIYNSVHLDILLAPLLLAALYFCLKQRHLSASAMLGLAVGVKLWPVYLMPVVLRPLLRRPARLLACGAVFAVLAGAALLPMARAGLGPDSGLTAYGRFWEMNDSLYLLILWGCRWLLGLIGGAWLIPQELARLITMAGLGGFCLWVVWKDRPLRDAALGRFLALGAALFLASPTGFPWYYAWLLPFLALCPVPGLLSLTALLPLYYLRFWLDGLGRVGLYDDLLVFIAFVPCWLLLIRDWRAGRLACGGGHV